MSMHGSSASALGQSAQEGGSGLLSAVRFLDAAGIHARLGGDRLSDVRARLHPVPSVIVVFAIFVSTPFQISPTSKVAPEFAHFLAAPLLWRCFHCRGRVPAQSANELIARFQPFLRTRRGPAILSSRAMAITRPD